MKPVDIGSRLELLVDDHLLEQLSGSAHLCMHRPVAREIVPHWDGGGCPYRYMTVFQDGGEYRMYYALTKMHYVGHELVKEPERICVAHSRDGKQWESPSVGIFKDNGTTDNPIVWIEDGEARRGVGGFSPFKDENPGCPPEHRYKAIAEAGPLTKEAIGRNGLFAIVSPDGLNWSMLNPEPVMTGGPGIGGFDSQNLAFWDAHRQEYRLYRREVFREGERRAAFRDILTATSRDFLNWSEPVRLSYPGAIREELYTNNVTPYFRAPHLFIGFPGRYVHRLWSEPIADLPEPERRKAVIRESGGEPEEKAPTEAGGQRAGTALTDTLFMTSRDGAVFNLWGEAFIRPGLRNRNNWFYADNFQNWGLVTTPSSIDEDPDELSFYVTEGSRRKGQSNICRRYTLRIDGFVSARALRCGGEVLTRPLLFSGRDLILNFSASAAGSVRVELQDTNGLPLSEFGLEDCVELLGDDLERTVRWKGDANLSSLAGVPIKIRFVLVDSDLYSFRFQ